MLSTNATKSMNIIKTNQFNQANRAWQNESNQIQNDKAYISTDNNIDKLKCKNQLNLTCAFLINFYFK